MPGETSVNHHHTSGYFTGPKRQGGILKKNGAATALGQYASSGEILKQRSPGGWMNQQDSSHLSQPAFNSVSKVPQGMSRNPKGIHTV